MPKKRKEPSLDQVEALDLEFDQMMLSDYMPNQRTKAVSSQIEKEFAKRSGNSRKKQHALEIQPPSDMEVFKRCLQAIVDKRDAVSKEDLSFLDTQMNIISRTLFGFLKRPSEQTDQFARLFDLIKEHIDAIGVEMTPIIGKSATCIVNLTKTKKGKTTKLRFIYPQEEDDFFQSDDPEDDEANEYAIATEWATFVQNWILLCHFRAALEEASYRIIRDQNSNSDTSNTQFDTEAADLVKKMSGAFQFFYTFLKSFDPKYATKLRNRASPLWFYQHV